MLKERPIRALVTLIHRHAYIALIVAIAFTAWTVYLSTTIGIRSKMKDLLPETAPSVLALDEVIYRSENDMQSQLDLANVLGPLPVR